MRTLFEIIVLIAIPICGVGQQITLTAAPVRPGAMATITVTTANVSGPSMQFFLPQIPGVAYSAALGAALTGKTLTCAPSPTPTPALFGCIVVGGINAIPDGVIAAITFPAPAPGAYALPLSLQLGASATGDPITVAAGPPLSLIVLSPCDINGDGKVDSADVAIAIQGAITRLISAALDLSGDGAVNVVDVQRVYAAANGGTCRAGA